MHHTMNPTQPAISTPSATATTAEACAPRLVDADSIIRLCTARAAELDDGSLRKRLDATAVRAAQELLSLALRVQAMAADQAGGGR